MIEGFLEGMLRREFARSDWHNSLWVAAFSMAQPTWSTCLPNEQVPGIEKKWGYGCIVRNFIYSQIFIRLGPDVTRWFGDLNLMPDQVKQLLKLCTRIMTINELSLEALLKRFMIAMVTGKSMKN